VQLAVGCLASPVYVLRAQGSAAVAAVAKARALVLPPPLLVMACRGLCAALPGRLWEGKEVILDAVAALCKQLAEPDVAAAAAAVLKTPPAATVGQKRPRAALDAVGVEGEAAEADASDVEPMETAEEPAAEAEPNGDESDADGPSVRARAGA
jgi:hypothetical protein